MIDVQDVIANRDTEIRQLKQCVKRLKIWVKEQDETIQALRHNTLDRHKGELSHSTAVFEERERRMRSAVINSLWMTICDWTDISDKDKAQVLKDIQALLISEGPRHD